MRTDQVTKQPVASESLGTKRRATLATILYSLRVLIQKVLNDYRQTCVCALFYNRDFGVIVLCNLDSEKGTHEQKVAPNNHYPTVSFESVVVL